MTATKQRSIVVGVFDDHRKAQQCVEELRRQGYREDQIGVAGRDVDNPEAPGRAGVSGDSMAAGAATGVAAGAGVGALSALGIAAGFLPAIGPVVAGGILGSLLASAAGGAAAGGLLGALLGLGIPEEEATYYEGEFKAGRVIVTVKAEDRYDEAQAILTRFGAYDMNSRGTASTSTDRARSMPAASDSSPAVCETGSSRVHAGAGTSVQVHEERLKTHKEPVKTGEVTLRKEVVTEKKTIEVPVEREEVVIERRAVAGGECSPGGQVKAGEEIRIPLKEEKVHVEKETVVTEEVNVGKRKVQDTKTVSGTVRKEQVRVEKDGSANVQTKAPARR